ncbi:MAG: class I SAM-dependent methyltransferase, partial [Candidatus Aenigmarchaeota archaeon]|nr:class I SAM-dependent methyltransferase [Candidatus Aenigmarchaeota archaeon]
MTSPFSGNFATRMIREASKDRRRILDAGCGTGVQACYLARRNTNCFVWGYDISEMAIKKAEEYKKKHGIPNVHFDVASHDDYAICEPVNFIYSNESLIGTDEYDYPLVFGPWESIVKRRLTRFHGMLLHGG